MADDPLHMSELTAPAAGVWTGMAVGWADDARVGSVIEGTWRNLPTVLDEAGHARQLGRRTHAVAVAVPPALSRLAILERFYLDVVRQGQARWTPPTAHETTVRNLAGNVAAIGGSGLMDRFTVVDRYGEVLYDGDDGQRFAQAWRGRFERGLDDDERERVRAAVEKLRVLAERYTPDNEEAREMVNALEA
ncbi:zeta toxin family protein [Bifidobacterium cuniculi]|uniref:UDP-N-acetylglucosamine kinase n=1 Tax=Bifidobacterium cuniculi TaxID=1688 RepID=A0A087AZM2_9BIFI|nr:zeta toxin family protein [Bifidobacterium cuniculi]KFI64222.1 Zeta toxin family protein [Bifidobacterium cuniculi]